MLDEASVGKSADNITTSLTTRGYEVRKGRTGDGLPEAHGLKGDRLYAVYVDASTGTVGTVGTVSEEGRS